jgi:nucleotide-binding universal stress UspA family protein
LKYQTVLVAYDGSPASDRAVQAAVDFAREGAQVIGVTVRAPTDDTDAEAPSTKLVEIIAAHTGAFGVRLSTELRTGHPAQEILAAARSHQADLLVLGHSGRDDPWLRDDGSSPPELVDDGHHRDEGHPKSRRNGAVGIQP